MYKLYCRIYQFILRIAMYFLPWREPILLKGENTFLKLPEFICSKGIRNVLVVTDAGLLKVGIPEPLFPALDKAGVKYSIYSGVVPNPTTDNISDALGIYTENGCEGIIAVGGGSPMDCAKAVAARAACPKKPISAMKGILKIHRKLPLLFAVPTTAGTGSETTLAAVITDSATSHKYAINDPSLIPYAAVLDPLLTVKLPQKVTATTGMDALCHAVEAYIGKSNTKKTKRDARTAVKLIFENLYKAYSDGGDIEARENMQNASYLAGLSFTRAYVGYVHAVAHTLGGMYHIAHGLANAIIMPYVFRRYGAAAHKPLAELAELVGLGEQGDTAARKAEKFISAIEDMNEKMNIETKIPEIREEDIDRLAEYAAEEGNPLYPVPRIMKKDEIKAIFYDIRQ